MYSLAYSRQFKKDLKRLRNDKNALLELSVLISMLAAGKVLPDKYRNHRLRGEFKDCYECHLWPDLLLVYSVDKEEVLLLMLRIGSHAELFG